MPQQTESTPYIPTTPQELHDAANMAGALDEVAKGRIVEAARGWLAQDEPKVAVASMLATIGHSIGRLSDDDWQRMMHAAPLECGSPNCHCHELCAELFEVLDRVRDKQRELNTPRRKA